MTVRKARKIFYNYCEQIELNNQQYSFDEFYKFLTPAIKAGWFLKNKGLMSSEEEETFSSMIDFRMTYFFNRKQYKQALKIRERIEKYNNSFYFAITDRKQILIVGTQFWRPFIECVKTNFCLNTFWDTLIPEMIEKRMYLIKGTRKAAAFLKMDEEDLIKRTSEIFLKYSKKEKL